VVVKLIIILALLVLLTGCTGFTEFESCMNYCAQSIGCYTTGLDIEIDCNVNGKYDKKLTEFVRKDCFDKCRGEKDVQ